MVFRLSRFPKKLVSNKLPKMTPINFDFHDREALQCLPGPASLAAGRQQGGSYLSAPCVLRMLCSVLQKQQGGSRVAAEADPSGPESAEALAVLAALVARTKRNDTDMTSMTP